MNMQEAMCEYTGGNMGMYRVYIVYECAEGQCLNKQEVIL